MIAARCSVAALTDLCVSLVQPSQHQADTRRKPKASLSLINSRGRKYLPGASRWVTAPPPTVRVAPVLRLLALYSCRYVCAMIGQDDDGRVDEQDEASVVMSLLRTYLRESLPRR
eukprot:GHVU01073116.1.p1 GENE.GHVU01073116.1~~GHVU01073116.1.p1  ORF type:complete len:115 (+),score=2.73 GHVU01073116.1:788-1132(+)